MEELVAPEQIPPDTQICSDSGGCSCYGYSCTCLQLGGLFY